MKNDVLSRAMRQVLSGKGAHVPASAVFAGLSWKLAGVRPPGVAHSAFQLLNHMGFWQDWAVQWLDGEDASSPRHASGSWPGAQGPATEADWRRAMARFRKGLGNLQKRCHGRDPLARRGAKTRLEMLQTIGSHNSYHAGQVVLLRQILGCWPPPAGGLTW